MSSWPGAPYDSSHVPQRPTIMLSTLLLVLIALVVLVDIALMRIAHREPPTPGILDGQS